MYDVRGLQTYQMSLEKWPDITIWDFNTRGPIGSQFYRLKNEVTRE